MPSRLENLKRHLEWTDFGPPKRDTPPKEGEMKRAAFTDAGYTVNYNTEWVKETKRYRLKDDVKIVIKLKPTSWVTDWALKTPRQKKLLNHERGHYKVAALMGRDAFIDIMQLKTKDYPTSAAVINDVKKILRKYNNATQQKIHNKYDEKKEAHHGLNDDGQRRWDGYFNQAFNTARTPAMKAPDGALYKVRLLDVLKKAGKL